MEKVAISDFAEVDIDSRRVLQQRHALILAAGE